MFGNLSPTSHLTRWLRYVHRDFADEPLNKKLKPALLKLRKKSSILWVILKLLRGANTEVLLMDGKKPKNVLVNLSRRLPRLTASSPRSNNFLKKAIKLLTSWFCKIPNLRYDLVAVRQALSQHQLLTQYARQNQCARTWSFTSRLFDLLSRFKELMPIVFFKISCV